MEKTVLQEAIAEAKQLRDAAIHNAYKQLEESLTPSIKEMLASKLEEGEIELDEEEENLEEATNSGFEEVKTNLKEEDSEEDAEAAEEDSEEAEEDAEDSEEDAEAAEEDSEKAEENSEEEEASDDTKLSDITLGDLKDLIADLIAAGAGTPAPEGDLGADMEPGDVEGMGDEEAPIEDVPVEPGIGEPGESEEEDDEIDISEILKELEEEELQESKEEETSSEESAELQEALETIKTLQNTVTEVNLLNSKLLYTTRVLQNASLSEAKKAFIIQKLDTATTPKAVKKTFTELTEGIRATATKKKTIAESKRTRQSASRPAGSSTAPARKEVIAESTDVVKRMQYLAGIITD